MPIIIVHIYRGQSKGLILIYRVCHLVSEVLNLNAMNKNIYKLEVLLILGAILISGLSIFAIFSAPSSKYVRFIKWSDVDSIEAVIENTAKRLYPQLAEANHIRIEGFEPITTLSHVSASINKITGLNSTAITQPALIVLDSNKKSDIQLKIIFKKVELNKIDTTKIFDEKSFKKILNKNEKGEQIKKYLFCLYQVKSNEFILEILSI